MYNRNNNRGGRDVCKFFLEGRCRFGDGCKNEHPGDGAGSSNTNRFAPLQNPSAGNARGRSGAVGGNGGQGQTSSQFGVTADGIRLDLTDNSQKGERPQWEFSSYAPGVGAPRQLLEGPLEQSEEEMRVMCYLANATGQLQAYDQHVNGMRNEMTQQIQRILNDTEGAKRYVQEGEHVHPNRLDYVQKSNRDFPWVNKPTVPPQQGNAFGQGNGGSSFGQANGAGSAFGQHKPAASGFGQASALGGASPFGQPSALGGGGASAFGQASNLGGVKPAFGQPAFGQASQPASSVFGKPSQPTSAFGQASQLAAPSAFSSTPPPVTSTFGQPSQPAANAFGQPSQPAANPFGQSSQPAANPFGQPSQPSANPFGQTQPPAATPFGQTQPPAASTFGQSQQPAASAFGQPSQPANPFGQTNQPAANAFGQPAQPAVSSAFGKPSPFGAAAPANSAFGKSSFGQQSAQSPFGQTSQNNSTLGQNTQPASSFGAASGGQSGPSAFGNKPPQAGVAAPKDVIHGQRIYKGKNDLPMVMVRKDGVEKETRVWFPTGGPTSSAKDTEGEPSAYEGEKGALLKEWYDQVRTTGEFPRDIMPECPPKREWVSFDL